jgi:uncharacterized radical SAM superfamily Fe-S cluster-containing enzyme
VKIATKSICPKCLKEIDAFIFTKGKKVYLEKKCEIHGKFKVMLSSAGEEYIKFLLIPRQKNQTYNLVLTARCNLSCPICFSSKKNYKEISVDWIKSLLCRFRNVKFNLFGGEPLLHPNLIEIIKNIRRSGNFVSIYTNGIKITDVDYLEKLKNVGLNEVHLQFDGFSDKIYKKLRGKRLLKIKIQALKALEKLDIPTVLEVTVVKNVNENHLGKIYEFALKKKFIRAVIFRSYGCLGKNKFDPKSKISIDEMIKILETHTNGKISIKKVLNFQKLLMKFYKFIKVPCANNQFFIILRNENSYEALNDVLKLDESCSIFHLFLNSLKRIKIVLPLFLSFLKSKLKGGINAFNLPQQILLIDFEFPCDIYTFNEKVIEHCMGGEIRMDYGILESKCLANILQEKELYSKLF